MFDELDYNELMILLQDAKEMQNKRLYKRIQDEINKRVRDYE